MPERLTPEREAKLRELGLHSGYEFVGVLFSEIDALRAQVAGHCERIAKQSEILSRRAEACPECIERDETIRQLREAARVVCNTATPPNGHQFCAVWHEDLLPLAALLPPEPGPTATKE